jgi:hypothetical protein
VLDSASELRNECYCAAWLKRVGAGARSGRGRSPLCSQRVDDGFAGREMVPWMEMVPVAMASSCGCGGKSIHIAVAKNSLGRQTLSYDAEAAGIIVHRRVRSVKAIQ